MKRIIRLTESDLTRIVRRVIKENALTESEEEALVSDIQVMDEEDPDPGLLDRLEQFAARFKKLPKNIIGKIKRLQKKQPNMMKKFKNINTMCPKW